MKSHNLRGHVPEHVQAAMMRLASAEPLADLPGILDLIHCEGRKKGNDWLKDKLVADRYALTGICCQMSLIPVESWKAGPNTTNGNEQAHRDANRDGIRLSLFLLISLLTAFFEVLATQWVDLLRPPVLSLS
ncbi:hypothetical protein M422DRAFT_267398 [Sphaerobolus stellatus SS14]|uniref:Unplaced genomic scaffold SPHSTscaffold_175, whole genome shotgun sequence n=1 Tax=Sphaerobolus stellatus (strain SS14) TaxID=990650 RepID=A0A0C9TM35_SPHS4|nr:hypothetical protein M422DRAFT_267398 [Sphaerobolus stellatus SS14]